MRSANDKSNSTKVKENFLQDEMIKYQLGTTTKLTYIQKVLKKFLPFSYIKIYKIITKKKKFF